MSIKNFEEFKEGVKNKKFKPVSDTAIGSNDFDKWIIEEYCKDESKQEQDN